MITEKPNHMLATSPNLDVKSYLDGKVRSKGAALETGHSMTMAIKYTGESACSFMGGYPVLRMASAARASVIQVLTDNRPEDLLYSGHEVVVWVWCSRATRMWPS